MKSTDFRLLNDVHFIKYFKKNRSNTYSLKLWICKFHGSFARFKMVAFTVKRLIWFMNAVKADSH